MANNAGKQINILRSCPSTIKCHVKFCNRTNKDVSLDWIDNHGHHKCYCQELRPSGHFAVTTYVGHPWMAYETQFRHQRVFSENRDIIYFPTDLQGNSDNPVQITMDIFTPINSLMDLCLQVLHMHLRAPADVSSLEITAQLKRRLLSLFENQKNKNIPVRLTPESQR